VAVDEILRLHEQDPASGRDIVEPLMAVCAKDGMIDEGKRALGRLRDAGVIGADYHDQVFAKLAAAQQAREAFLRLVRGN